MFPVFKIKNRIHLIILYKSTLNHYFFSSNGT